MKGVLPLVLALGIVLLAACAVPAPPASPPPPAVTSPEPFTQTPRPIPVTGPESLTETPTNVPIAQLKTDFSPTDPKTVNLAAGKPQLIEFYAVW